MRPDARLEVCLQPLRAAQFERLAALAGRIWREHYPGIISHAQIDYMLRGRFAPAALERYLHADRQWLDLLYRGDAPIGYCSYACADDPEVLKLEQLYLGAEQRGRGYGSLMLRHVESRARAMGVRRIVLTVNKANAASIAVYAARGFEVRAEIRVDIGEGFVMDDYVMECALS